MPDWFAPWRKILHCASKQILFVIDDVVHDHTLFLGNDINSDFVFGDLLNGNARSHFQVLSQSPFVRGVVSVCASFPNVWLLNYDRFYTCSIECLLIFHFYKLINPKWLQCLYLKHRISHIKVWESSSLLKEPFFMQVIEHGDPAQIPIVGVLAIFIGAFPNGEVRIQNPNAVLRTIVRYLVGVINDVFFLLEI